MNLENNFIFLFQTEFHFLLADYYSSKEDPQNSLKDHFSFSFDSFSVLLNFMIAPQHSTKSIVNFVYLHQEGKVTTPNSKLGKYLNRHEKWHLNIQCESEVKIAQLCPTLCDPMDCIVHEILQARILERVAFPFSRGSSQSRNQTGVSCIASGFFTN